MAKKKLKNSAKEVYYQNVKPNIDKAMTNPFTAGLIGGVPGVIGSYFYKPDFDARKAKTQDEAYKMARSTGAKTFIWNGKHYNTDYKGNPKKTLVQQKQEELDTYGITNEQAQNKNLIAQRLHNNLYPGSYDNPVGRVFDAVVLNKKSEFKNDSEKSTRQDLFDMLLGYPQTDKSLKISKYKPKNSKDKYYYALNKGDENVLKDSDSNGYDYIKDVSSGMPNNSNTIVGGGEFGKYTLGKTKDYLSYYDKWDINPFGSGNDKPLMELGKPLNIYDRKYFDENNTKKSLGGDIMIKKKKNKFVVPREYNQSAIFAHGGNLYGLGGLPTDFKSSAAGQFAAGNVGAGLSGALGAAPGIMGLANSTIKDFDTSGIGKEVVGTQDMTRSDILNTNVNVNSQQKGFGAIAGDAASAAMTGIQVAGPWGALAGLVPIATGIFGNEAKQNKAEQAEQQWTNNLQAKNRQFQGQDLRQSMANFSANGGDLFAYGGNMKSQLTSFESGGSHQSNPNGGILQGTGANGQPNLVEEGETKHEDYIFSDRLKINPQISKDFKLPKGLNGKTFADASKYLNREAKDRPNDPISNNGVKAQLAKLTAAQEGLKAQQQPQQGIPMEGQPDANILAQGYANGGFIDQTHYQNPTLQGANIGDDGMTLTKSNTPLVGIDQNAYARNMKLQGVDWKVNPLSNVKDINLALKEDAAFRERNPYQQEEVQSTDYSRYAPVAANIAMGISDMFEKPEVVKFGRVSPERITARMDYQPIDTEWMNNKMNATYAGTRDQMINQAGGNRAMAMAGLAGINQQQQNALGEAYIRAQDINYGRKNQATQFNAGIEAQNVAAQNAAQQTNLQLQMQEMDANARNRAAKRNAARQAILNAASNVGDIGRENWAAKTGEAMYGYKTDGQGNIIYKKQ